MRSASVKIVFALLAAPAAAQTYEAALIPPQIIGSPQTMTALNGGDDSTRLVQLGFPFEYYGQTFTSAWVSSNGFVSFYGPANLCCNGQPIEQAQRNTIYAYWTDLINRTNPYYQTNENVSLFGWYGTNEYGTNNSITFEIGLFPDGKIQINYGSLANSGHTVTAGITGPNETDNVSLFHGQNVQFLQNQSGVLVPHSPTPEVVLDCNATPLDPACPPPSVTPVSIAALVSAVTSEAAPEETAQEEVAQAETAVEVATVAEPAQEIAVEAAQETTSVTAQVAEAITAERLSPDQVAALAAPVADFSPPGTGTTIELQMLGGMAQIGAAQSTGSASLTTGVVETVSSSSSPSSIANTLEALGMSSAPVSQASMTQSDQQTSNAMSEGQGETMAAIAAVPGFSAYTQVSLQDRPDFYAIRDIYRNRRLRDASFELYRMTQTNDAKWREMVNEQY